MNDFKFNCPKCGQHILANASWIGRRLNCPSCSTRITIPAPIKPQKKEMLAAASAGSKPKTQPSKLQTPSVKPEKNRITPGQETNKTEPATSHPPIAPPKVPAPNLRVESGTKPDKSSTVSADTRPAIKVAEAAKPGPIPTAPKSAAIPEEPKAAEQPRVGILSTTVKLDLVRAVRRRIAKESAWLPGTIDGTIAYAARMEGGKPALVEAKNSEATRFSLMGAFLVEMDARRVIRTATGRKKFLDEEIPEAIREVLVEQLSDEERERTDESLAEKDLLAISHAQCLAALDALEERYSQRMDQLRIEKAKRRLGNVRLADLVKKLEKKARVLPEDVATALYHELVEVRRRLEKLENRIAKGQ